MFTRKLIRPYGRSRFRFRCIKFRDYTVTIPGVRGRGGGRGSPLRKGGYVLLLWKLSERMIPVAGNHWNSYRLAGRIGYMIQQDIRT